MGRRVFVAMSGGVDSSVAAALLVREGHDVTGVTMLLLEGDGLCCGESGARDARRVCDVLGVPHYVFDLRDSFERDVVIPYADAYAEGRTPNPCIDCNDRLKFAELLRRVSLQGAEVLATGHYARIVRGRPGARLARGADRSRDQSYFLYRMGSEQMERALFPVGGMLKSEVRRMAGEMGLPTASRPESREACFVPDARARAQFVAARRPEAGRRGPILDGEGRLVGEHRGLVYYTVGQRRGLGGGGDQPRYVTRLDAAGNAVRVGSERDASATVIEAADPVWHGPARRSGLTAKVRYRGREVPCAAVLGDGALRVVLCEPLLGVAPGQAIVCYDGEAVVGGGRILEAR